MINKWLNITEDKVFSTEIVLKFGFKMVIFILNKFKILSDPRKKDILKYNYSAVVQ